MLSPVAGVVQGGAGAYGYRTHPVTGERGVFHAGSDIACPVGTPVVAPEPGRVVFAGWAGSHPLTRGRSGICVVFRGDRTGRDWYFGHLSELKAPEGARVGAGAVLGLSGATGNVTGPHVHLEVRYAGTTDTVDPLRFMRSLGVTPGAANDFESEDDDMPRLSDEVPLQKAASEALNGLDKISYSGATQYAAAGGWLVMKHLPALLAEVRELRTEVEALRREVRK